MNDYIYNQLATERAQSLRAEASAHRLGKRLGRRDRKVTKALQAAHSLRIAH